MTKPKPTKTTSKPTPPIPVTLATEQDWQSVVTLIELGAKAIGCQLQSDGITTFETAGRLIREITQQAQKPPNPDTI